MSMLLPIITQFTLYKFLISIAVYHLLFERHPVEEIYYLLGYYAEDSSNSLPTFRDKLRTHPQLSLNS
jgi:hypothetical protein